MSFLEGGEFFSFFFFSRARRVSSCSRVGKRAQRSRFIRFDSRGLSELLQFPRVRGAK